MGMVFYVAILKLVGYVTGTVILSGIILFTLKTKPWYTVLAVSVLLSVSSYLLFDRLLGIVLPKGIWIPF